MTKPDNEKKCDGFHTKNDGSYWEYDKRGIPLTRVCDCCRKEKLSKYKPSVLRR